MYPKTQHRNKGPPVRSAAGQNNTRATHGRGDIINNSKYEIIEIDNKYYKDN
jgi:hypothetical protein